MGILRVLRSTVLLLVFALSISAGAVSLAAEEKASSTTPSTVNINTASAEAIALVLTGIGTKRAEAIIAYREKNGSFSELEELQNVKGVGEKVVEKNADRITF